MLVLRRCPRGSRGLRGLGEVGERLGQGQPGVHGSQQRGPMRGAKGLLHCPRFGFYVVLVQEVGLTTAWA